MDSHARKFSAEESLLVAQQRIIELKAERDEECESARRYSELFATEKERADRLEAKNARLREAGEKLLRMVEFELQDNAQEPPWSGLLNRMHAALEGE